MKAMSKISIFSFQHLHVDRIEKESLSCLLLQIKKADSSSCATKSQKDERNKKKEEESNSLKTAILELLLEIMIFCFVKNRYQNPKRKDQDSNDHSFHDHFSRCSDLVDIF